MGSRPMARTESSHRRIHSTGRGDRAIQVLEVGGPQLGGVGPEAVKGVFSEFGEQELAGGNRWTCRAGACLIIGCQFS